MPSVSLRLLWIPAVLSLLPTLARAGTSTSNLITNPSFEASIWLAPDWNCSCSVNANSCGINHPGWGPGQVSEDGTNSAYIDPSCVLFQPTAAVAGATYELSFSAYAAYELRNSLQPNVQIGWGANALVWTAGSGIYLSVLNATDVNGTADASHYGSFQFNLTASGNDVISFGYTPEATASDNSTASQGATLPVLRVDNVTLTQLTGGSGSSSSGNSSSSHSNKGLVAGCAVLGVVAFFGLLWGAVATRRVLALNKALGPAGYGREEMMTTREPQMSAVSYPATSERMSTPGSGKALSSSAHSERPPEIMNAQGGDRSWNMYEQDTYQDFPGRGK